jgi:hypothetical protein
MRIVTHAANGRWISACTGRLAYEANEVVFEIARELSSARVSDPSLTGEGGIALFYCYLSLSFPGRGFDEAARQCLERAVTTMASTETSYWLMQKGLFLASLLVRLR